MAKPWTKGELTELIRFYKQYPVLYDASHEHYYNKNRRDLALKSILEKLNMPDLTIDGLKAKIKLFRSQFLSEKLRIQAAKDNNEPNAKPTLWCYPILTFLDGHVGRSTELERKRRREASPGGNSTTTTTTTAPLPGRDYSTQIEKAAIESLDKINSLMADEIKQSWFGNFINEEINEIQDRKTRSRVKWEIQLILKRAREKDAQKAAETEEQLIQQAASGHQINHDEGQLINVLSSENITYLQAVPTSNGLTHIILADPQMEVVTGGVVTDGTGLTAPVAVGGEGGGGGDEQDNESNNASPTKSYDTDDISEPDMVEESLRRLCNSEDDI